MDLRENGYNGLYGNGHMGKWTWGKMDYMGFWGMDLRENELQGKIKKGLKGKWTLGKMDLREN